jgi:hypothetical protein
MNESRAASKEHLISDMELKPVVAKSVQHFKYCEPTTNICRENQHIT